MMRYQEFPPPPGLAGLVDCLWLAHMAPAPGAAAFSHRVLPDNCVDILWQDSGAAFFVGMMSRWIDVPAAAPTRTVAVRFRPGAAAAFLGAPSGRGTGTRTGGDGLAGAPALAELADGRASLDLLWGRSDADRLGDALWSVARSDAERLALITDALYARLGASSPAARSALAQASRAAASRLALAQGGALAREAVALLEASGGALRVEALAGQLGVSRQHLAAQFRDHVGLSPKLFARVARFQRAKAAASAARQPGSASAPALDWAAVAQDCGYFDQSHLIRDFHDFAGASPDAFLLAR